MNDIEYFKKTIYKTSKGFVSLAYSDESNGWSEYIYRVKELGIQMTLFENNKNVNIYSSINTFYHPKRKFENLYNLNSLFCDIDCVKHDISKKQAFKELFCMWRENIIPEPSMVVDSGNGLHVYWNLENCYASTKNNVSFVPTYQALLNTFAKKLSFIGADFISAEPSRVLGVPSTYNIKSGTQRKIIHPQEQFRIIHANNTRYKIIELAQTYLVKKEYKEKKVTYEKRQTKFNELTLAHARMEDYKVLIKGRNQRKINEGYRNQLLYNYGLENIDYTKSKDNLKNSLLEINNMFRKPITEQELKGIIKSLENSKFKKIKNQTIIEQLEISSIEQERMSTLIEREIKVARYVEKKKINRRNENGLTKREQSREDNIYLILDGYYIQNKTRKQISQDLILSFKTVNNYIDRDINVKDKILFLLEKKISKRNIMKKLNLTQYMLSKILDN